jgi:hypothetical protein
VTKHIGTRSVVQLQLEEANGINITYKRDIIGMLLLKKPKAGDPDPTIPQRAVIGTQIHTGTNTPMQLGEHIIIKDGPLVTIWYRYCAEVVKSINSRLRDEKVKQSYLTPKR